MERKTRAVRSSRSSRTRLTQPTPSWREHSRTAVSKISHSSRTEPIDWRIFRITSSRRARSSGLGDGTSSADIAADLSTAGSGLGRAIWELAEPCEHTEGARAGALHPVVERGGGLLLGGHAEWRVAGAARVLSEVLGDRLDLVTVLVPGGVAELPRPR